MTTYDGVGRVVQSIDARGTFTAFGYDAAGRRLAVTNAVGISGVTSTNLSYTYDNYGNQITFTDANDHTSTNVLDVLNRLVQVYYPDGTKSSTGFDADGRSVAQTNQDGVVTLFGYDGSGRLISVTNAQSQVTQYQYDQAGNEIAQIDALYHTNTYVYDGIGRKLLHVRPDGSQEGFEYDLNGNFIAHTNFDSNIIVFSQYDELDRLTNCFSELYGYNDLSYTYTYTATGQRQSMVCSDTPIVGYPIIFSYGYDLRDRLIQKEMAASPDYNAFSEALNYKYDANGNVTNIMSDYANGVNLMYRYDPLNRLTNALESWPIGGKLFLRFGRKSTGNAIWQCRDQCISV